ncbi:hypothetical protein EGW08_009711, partial [Elysia chlorotica]
MSDVCRLRVYRLMSDVCRLRVYRLMSDVCRLRVYRLMSDVCRLRVYRLMSDVCGLRVYRLMSDVCGLRVYHAVLGSLCPARPAPVGVVLLDALQEGRQVLGHEQALERVAELLRHDAVEDEVDGAVDEHEDVHEVSQLDVDVLEEDLVHGADPGDDALRQLGDDEAEHHGHQHLGRAVVLRAGVVLDHARDVVEQARAALLGLLHGDDEQHGQVGQHDAGQHLDDHAVQPAHEVDVLGVAHGEVGRVHVEAAGALSARGVPHRRH